ncbi:MAG TPA: carbon-nitrogen hydrolase family protein [Candidatus Eisenbacteria bacterium]|nr:carbon-nitrogen hydrolase family protein [Candidatus Eisenbacteria bacterium]
MTRARSVAAAQTIPARGDLAANLDAHLRFARAAADAGAGLLVFPELSLTGYELDLADALAFSEDDPRLAPLVDLAISRSMTLVVGAPVRIGARLHIGAFVLAPDGPIAVYTKRRLGAFPASANPGGAVPPAEASVFEPGDRDPLIRFGDRTAAIAVCADTGAPEHPKRAAERGATIYLASMFLIPSDLEKEAPVLRSYAVRHRMTVLLANYGGPSGGLPTGGGSAVWSDTGGLLTRLDASGPGLVVATERESGWGAEAVSIPG